MKLVPGAEPGIYSRGRPRHVWPGRAAPAVAHTWKAPSDRLTPTRGRREAAPILSLLTSGFLDGGARASAWARRWRSPPGRSVSGTDRGAPGSGGGATRRGGQRWGGRESTDGSARGREGGEGDVRDGPPDKDETTTTR